MNRLRCLELSRATPLRLAQSAEVPRNLLDVKRPASGIDPTPDATPDDIEFALAWTTGQRRRVEMLPVYV